MLRADFKNEVLWSIKDQIIRKAFLELTLNGQSVHIGKNYGMINEIFVMTIQKSA